jgi:hypothetical protein
MAAFDLLTLDLRSPLAYPGMENPPLAGAPLKGKALLPSPAGGFTEVGLGMDMAEGEEELFLFDPEELVAFDPDEGPRVDAPLPRPRFYGRRSPKGGADPAAAGEAKPSVASLAIGSYAFLQWRPKDEDELLSGIEWFAKEAWWERLDAKGPYIVRRVREDGQLATQALRRLP